MTPKFKIGQKVFFKSDVEQYGIIINVINDRYANEPQYEVKPADGRFYGDYIHQDAKTTTLYESDCHET